MAFHLPKFGPFPVFTGFLRMVLKGEGSNREPPVGFLREL